MHAVLWLVTVIAAEVMPFDAPPSLVTTTTTTGVFVFWPKGGRCVLPPGAGPRVYNSTPPTTTAPTNRRVWVVALERFKRVKVVQREAKTFWLLSNLLGAGRGEGV